VYDCTAKSCIDTMQSYSAMSMCWPRPLVTRPDSAAQMAATPCMPAYMSAIGMRKSGGGSPGTPINDIAPLFASAIRPNPRAAHRVPCDRTPTPSSTRARVQLLSSA
jgi:hypothetical protein